jgi:GT2 family glycosyltransferase
VVTRPQQEQAASPAQPTPEVSVVLPTHRRPAGLARALAGLAAQEDAPAFEVVVVDNDSTPHPAPVLPDALQGRVVAEPVPGAAAARNRGLAEATAPLVAMLDDDVVPDPRWLAELVAPVRADAADVVGGKVVLDPAVPRPRWLAPSIEGYLTALDLGPHPRPLEPSETLLTASLLAPTDLLRRTGFAPDLGPLPGRQLVGDDVALVRDLRAAGARAHWAPGAVVVHDLPAERLRPSWVLRRAWLQGRSDWRVDRAALQQRRARGARVAASWLGGELRQRRREGPRVQVAFHAACDVARTGGALAEAASWRAA